MSYIRATGSLNNCQVVNLRCIGLLYEMTSKTYSLDDESALTLIPEFYNLIDIENASLLSNDFTPAGLILTDIVAKYVFGLEEEFEYWLPEDNRVMHIKELVVDGDIKSEGNIVAYGDVSSGG